jgi:hypothetical protein
MKLPFSASTFLQDLQNGVSLFVVSSTKRQSSRLREHNWQMSLAVLFLRFLEVDEAEYSSSIVFVIEGYTKHKSEWVNNGG